MRECESESAHPTNVDGEGLAVRVLELVEAACDVDKISSRYRCGTDKRRQLVEWIVW